MHLSPSTTKYSVDAVHADIHIEVACDLKVVEAHRIAREVENALKPLLGNGVCTVHIDPNPAESLAVTRQAALRDS